MSKQSVSKNSRLHETALTRRIKEIMSLRGLKQRSWSMVATGKADSIRNILTGKSASPRYATLEALADAAGISVDYLTGKSDSPGDAPALSSSEVVHGKLRMIGYIGAGDQVYHFGIGEAQLEPIDAPPGVTEGLAAVVRGTSMEPVYRDGETVIASAHHGELDELVNLDCFVQVHQGPLYLKVLRRTTKNKYALESYNNIPPMSGLIIEWAAPVTWVKRL